MQASPPSVLCMQSQQPAYIRTGGWVGRPVHPDRGHGAGRPSGGPAPAPAHQTPHPIKTAGRELREQQIAPGGGVSTTPPPGKNQAHPPAPGTTKATGDSRGSRCSRGARSVVVSMKTSRSSRDCPLFCRAAAAPSRVSNWMWAKPCKVSNEGRWEGGCGAWVGGGREGRAAAAFSAKGGPWRGRSRRQAAANPDLGEGTLKRNAAQLRCHRCSTLGR